VVCASGCVLDALDRRPAELLVSHR